MKTTLTILAILSLIISCTKTSDETIPSYYGTYNDSKGETAIVSQNGDYVKIDWRRDGVLVPYLFDSVRLNPDLTFTDNESVTIQWPLPNTTTFKSVGTGNFGTNTLNFSFTCSGATIIYNGVKKN